jgi:hypothetical protein
MRGVIEVGIKEMKRQKIEIKTHTKTEEKRNYESNFMTVIYKISTALQP